MCLIVFVLVCLYCFCGVVFKCVCVCCCVRLSSLRLNEQFVCVCLFFVVGMFVCLLRFAKVFSRFVFYLYLLSRYVFCCSVCALGFSVSCS